MKEKTATFIGHNKCYDIDTEQLSFEIARLIDNGVTTFLSGGYGGFDRLCANMVYKLKKEQSLNINNIIIIPYLEHRIFAPELFDRSEFPESLEKILYKFRIIHRNRYMVDNSDYAICYVFRSYGGAAQTYDYAKRRGLHIIDIKKRQQSS